MIRIVASVALIAGLLALGPGASVAQQTPAPKQAAVVKAGKGQRVCRVKLKYTGEIRTWVCKKEEPCCAWHEINYVKCGSTTFGCL